MTEELAQLLQTAGFPLWAVILIIVWRDLRKELRELRILVMKIDHRVAYLEGKTDAPKPDFNQFDATD